MTSIALICTANRCRSVMAHAILVDETQKRNLPIEVYSAGVLDFSDQPQLKDTLMTCLRNNTLAPPESPTWVGELPLDEIDRFLVMEQFHADALTRDFGISPDRISFLGSFDPQCRGAEIADPFGLGEAVYERQYQLIRDCIVGYLEQSRN
ncbi:MAG: hypothetical protein ABR607_03545 [Pyrinomonadaceae bacterium]